MSLITSDNAHYAAIASAIRGKLGSQTTYKPSEMAAAINSIPADNGNNIADFTFDGSGNLTAVQMKPQATRVRMGAFKNATHLTHVDFTPNITRIEVDAFRNCNLVWAELPDNVIIFENAFAYGFDTTTAGTLINIYIPGNARINSNFLTSMAPFYQCTGLYVWSDAYSVPDTWGTNWDFISSGETVTFMGGTSREEFREMVGG